MKRIAAIAALMITMLAIPAAAALAGTGSAVAPGGGKPGTIELRCRLPYAIYKGRHPKVEVVMGKVHGRLFNKAKLAHLRGKQIRIDCPFLPAKPLHRFCRPRPLTFSMAAGSSTVTEVSGPVLAPPEEFTYDGHTYTIMSVNPGADSFTVFLNGWLFVNKGPAITNATGYMVCPS